ncbi:MAG: TIGR02757 family protein [Spirochaetales bacterium]|nr:TIGR02757 family protein [Spirochaetales bacterium]
MPVKKQYTFHYLEHIYFQYNDYQYIFTDPVMFLHTHTDKNSCELTGLVVSALSYGRVAQIHKSIREVINSITLSPEYLLDMSDRYLLSLFSGFKHRFTSGEEVGSFLVACKNIYRIHGSLYQCFLSHYKDSHTTFVPALTGFIRELRSFFTETKSSLLPDPGKGSACKRLHLFLRWMIRKDEIDPGPWSGLPCSKLIIPLDTHMHRIARDFGFTRRNQADIKTAMEITGEFIKINPADPVKYDFALTRIGMGKTRNHS